MATFTINLLTGEKYLFSGNFSNSGSTTFSGLTSSSNGLTTVGHQVKLGGVLTQNTVFNGGASLFNLRYAGDYSGNFTTRSLVDKGYVDLQISAHTPTWLTLTNIPAWLTGATLSAFEAGHKHSQYLTGVTWTIISGRPAWLTGTTLSAFETGHTHSYLNLTNKLLAGKGILISGNTISVTGDTGAENVTLQLVDISGNTEVNTIAPTPIVWTTVEFTGTTFNFTGGSKIYITQNGIYGIGYTLNVINQDSTTKNLGTVVKKNGITDITTTTSASFAMFPNYGATNTMAIYKVNLLAGDYIELVAYRIGDAGSVLTVPSGSWITLIKY